MIANSNDAVNSSGTNRPRTLFLLGFFLGPIALVVASCIGGGNVKLSSCVKGWLCGCLAWILLASGCLAIHFHQEEAERVRIEKARKEEMRRAAIEEQRQREALEAQAAETRRIEMEKQSKRSAYREYNELRTSVNQSKYTINAILAGQILKDFSRRDIRFVDTKDEELLKDEYEYRGLNFTQAEIDKSIEGLKDALKKAKTRIDRLQSIYDSKLVDCPYCAASGFSNDVSNCAICLGTGKTKADAPCDVCDGSGRLQSSKVCSKCSGEGCFKVKERCGFCNGNGMVVCSACEGKGGSYVTPYKSGIGGRNMSMRKQFVRCEYCRGKKKVKCSCVSKERFDFTETCDKCGGTGSVTVFVTCKSCNGAGVKHSEEDCSNCNKGKVERRVKCVKCNGNRKVVQHL